MRIRLLILTGLAAAASGAILAPAGPASAAGESALQTIATLEAQGFDVRVNRVGSAPLNECTVTNVRNVSRANPFILRGDDDDDNPFLTPARRTITVSVNCSR